MDIYIADEERLLKYSISNKMEEFVSFNCKLGKKHTDCFITIDVQNKKRVLTSNGTCKIISNQTFIPSVSLEPYHYYVLQIEGTKEQVILYSIPTMQEAFYPLALNQLQQIKIGNSKNCEICYQTPLLEAESATIILKEKQWYFVPSAQTKIKMFKNRYMIQRTTELNIGDMIFIGGLKLIWMGDFIEINNPNNSVGVSKLSAYSFPLTTETYQPATEEEEAAVSLYQESDYFYHIPRIREVLETSKIKIDPPTSPVEKEELPWWLTMGSSITMSAAAFLMAYNVGYGLYTGTRTFWQAFPQIVMCIAMLVGSLLLPRIANHYQKKRNHKKEMLRKTKYTEYLQGKEKEISQIMKQHMQIMNDNIPSLKECLDTIAYRKKNFWSRVVSDDDFLNVRLGLGDVEPVFTIEAPEEKFTIDEDELLQKVYTMIAQYKKMTNVPIAINLAEKRVVSFVCEQTSRYQYIQNYIMQLVTLHSPEDLKIVIFTNKERAYHWDFMKYMPHCFNESKSMRFFATDIEEAKDISNELISIFKNQQEIIKKSQTTEDGKEIDQRKGYRNFSTYYLIINDDYQTGKNIPIITNILESDVNFGFSLFVISDTMKNLPSTCQTFIEAGAKDGALIERDITTSGQIIYHNEPLLQYDIYKYTRKLASIPIALKEGVNTLPKSISFMEMLGISKVEQLNVSTNWETNDPVLSLAAPIGVHESGELFKLNLHEKSHGPHGLVAGSTGSGKSEFIITYILSMAINYHPYEVQFVLIDYKGGGLTGAFENKETGLVLPHLAGTITNLDISEMNRTLVSIQSELKRRQRIFNEVRDNLGESTIDIYKYQRLYREGVVKVPMAHLFIISDEFAELKSQQPEFMSQLISISRIGRSLGVHLILATQKPSGVVNDQIWSNSKFKVCLKVQSRADSMEMLKRPEAASIKETGRFYLQVGYDDLFMIGQSAWSGAKYIPSEHAVKKMDDAIDVIGNIGDVIRSFKPKVKVENTNNNGDQLTNIVRYLYELGQKNHIVTNKLWLDAIPDTIYVSNLKKKYQYQPTAYQITPVIGEYDNPEEQMQGIVNLNLSDNGNTAIFGQTGSGKENLISTILWSTMIEHTPQEVQIYIMDFGSETLRAFQAMPHVGDVMTIDEIDKIVNAVEMLENLVEERKGLFAEYGGSYQQYCELSGKKLPLVLTVINGYDTFMETYGKVTEQMQNLYRDGSKYGVVFIVAAVATNAIRSRMLQNFSNVICLQIPNTGEYRTLLNAPRNLVPASIFGRGLIKLHGHAYEFQTALFAKHGEMIPVIRKAAEKLSSAYQVKVPKVPMVPEVVNYKMLLSSLDTLAHVPLGYDVYDKKSYCYDFTNHFITPIIAASMDEDKMEFVYALALMMQQIKSTTVEVIDCVEAFEKELPGITCIKEKFDEALVQINNRCIQEKDTDQHKVYLILGVGALKSKLSEAGNELWNHFMEIMKEYKNVHFVIVDTYVSYRTLQFEPWYHLIDSSCGIWLGLGIGNQVAFNITELTMEDRKKDFPNIGFSILKGKYTLIKCMVSKEVDNEK